MRSRWFHRFLAAALVLFLLPGMGEVVENLEQLLHDGHGTQNEQQQLARVLDHQDSGHQESGCTPILHVCTCHSSTPLLLLNAVLLPRIGLRPHNRSIFTLKQHPRDRYMAPPHRPPIA